ncbi:cytidine deaminase [Paenibacillus xerothermodurans]|uniref:Cytidine deaminase n=1 Tax=Paenibacillus xerothermodurans TaxID=1977292 RepID=A0A2W1NVT7_PAEXE|nr:cytidine deaminase [Paenibacillus xerothermodurans]PZE22693.1 cytidine deaminase [Paenibacillus xerothermodurans]
MDTLKLVALAKDVRERAYVPYSKFKVGSALLGADGTVYLGCNVENAAYGPTHCAERTAMHRAIADGAAPKSFTAMAVVGDTEQPITPCGICRQVMIELCSPEMPVYLANMQGAITETTVAALLPGAFTSHELNGGQR